MSLSLYPFTLAVTGLSFDNDDEIDALHPNCADAIVTHHGKNVFIEFDREHNNYIDAVINAILDVEKKPTHCSCDFGRQQQQ